MATLITLAILRLVYAAPIDGDQIMQFAKLVNGYAEIKDDGTWKLYPVHFEQAGKEIIKITYDDAGRVINKEFYEPQHLLTVDAVTGQLQQIQTGFVLEHELCPPVHPDPDKRYVQLRKSALPEDLFVDARVPAYRWDNDAGQLVRRDAEDIATDLAVTKRRQS